MVIFDFSVAIALFAIITVAGTAVLWICGKKEKENQMHLDPRFIWYCSVCTYTYVNTKEEVISLCPRCGSYNKKAAEKST